MRSGPPRSPSVEPFSESDGDGVTLLLARTIAEDPVGSRYPVRRQPELMARAGHSSPTAALSDLHATSDRDDVLADALAEFVAPTPVTASVAPTPVTASGDETAETSRQDRAKRRRAKRADLLSPGLSCPRQESNPQPGG